MTKRVGPARTPRPLWVIEQRRKDSKRVGENARTRHGRIRPEKRRGDYLDGLRGLQIPERRQHSAAGTGELQCQTESIAKRTAAVAGLTAGLVILRHRISEPVDDFRSTSASWRQRRRPGRHRSAPHPAAALVMLSPVTASRLSAERRTRRSRTSGVRADPRVSMVRSASSPRWDPGRVRSDRPHRKAGKTWRRCLRGARDRGAHRPQRPGATLAKTRVRRDLLTEEQLRVELVQRGLHRRAIGGAPGRRCPVSVVYLTAAKSSILARGRGLRMTCTCCSPSGRPRPRDLQPGSLQARPRDRCAGTAGESSLPIGSMAPVCGSRQSSRSTKK